MDEYTFSPTYGPNEDFEFRDSQGNNPVLIWSINDADQLWCSFNSEPEMMAPDAGNFLNLPTTLTTATDNNGNLVALDCERYAVYYDPKVHWLGWNPIRGGYPPSGTLHDSLEFLFDQSPVATEVLRANIPTSSSSDGYKELEGDVGVEIDSAWREDMERLSHRLRDISLTLVRKSPFYGPNVWDPTAGDMPGVVSNHINWAHLSERDAQRAAATARRNLLSQLGFLSWFTTVKVRWPDDLEAEDIAWIKALRLDKRGKCGYLFKLGWDHFEINIPFMIAHDVPFHYAWTDKERDDGQFTRYSSLFLNECSAARSEQGGGKVDIKRLACYEVLKPDLLRYDVFFQDRSSSRLGRVLSNFRPEDDYGIVDFYGYGVRPIDDWHERRAYSERFKGLCRRGVSNRMVTFHRQSPLGADKPAVARSRAGLRTFELTAFALSGTGSLASEDAAYYESTYLVREQVKNRYAPRRDRVFSTYDGRRMADSPIRGIPQPTEVALRASQRRGLQTPTRSDVSHSSLRADDGHGSHRLLGMEHGYPGKIVQVQEPLIESAPLPEPRSSAKPADASRTNIAFSQLRRLSSKRGGGGGGGGGGAESFHDEFLGLLDGEEAGVAQVSTGSRSLLGNSPGVRNTIGFGFWSNEDAVAAIQGLTEILAPLDPPAEPQYADEFLWDLEWIDCTFLVLKDRRTHMHMKVYAACSGKSDVLEILTLALKFRLAFGIYVDSAEVRKFRSAKICALTRNTLGYLYAPGYIDVQLVYGLGNEECYGAYIAKVGSLLSRPHAIAFIGMGGILSFVAQLYDPHLLFRFLRVPSLQVSEYQKGDQILHMVDGNEIFLIADSVSPSENLKEEIMDGRYKWRTRKQWVQYFRAGNLGKHAPTAGTIPSKADFQNAMTMVQSAFPLSWDRRRLRDIQVPEFFEPLAHRE
ncbi:hypothetical protein B0H15DRAFT_972268 [Mycena belliarum]|uniref:Uncharacterized protein n=1 Tax=Mycena belliarum TaxID=1033014 RepID=A0AAD6TP68_9AGAR|nr:hypothetical protein B0H15DRAFT_972268 [Mycena belliae]